MGEIDKFSTDSHGLLTQCIQVWVPNFGRIEQTVLEEAHKSRFWYTLEPPRCIKL